MAASLSLCLLARKPATRVRALLALMRPLADEIVLAADRTGDPDILGRCAGLADRRFEVEPAPLNRHLGWLLHECRGDWVLWLEDDEVPSRALLDDLPAVLAERGPSQIAFPRRWLHGDSGRFIASAPWGGDLQTRLLRNVPGLWRFPGRLHEPIEVLGERRCAEAPIYHADLLLAGADARRAKRDAYEARRPGLLAHGRPINLHYTPEDVPGLELESVPAADRALVDAVAAGRVAAPRRRRLRAARVERIDLGARDRFSAARPAHATTHRGTIELLRPRETAPPGAWLSIAARVRNRGGERWSAGEGAGPPVRVGLRWIGPSGDVFAEERLLLPESVAPGATSRVALAVRAPRRPGAYELELDLVHEHVTWFGSPARMALEVVARTPAAPTEAPRQAACRSREHAQSWVPPLRSTGIEGAHVLELEPAADERGHLTELLRHAWLPDDAVPLQWNLVVNGPRALRGMHWHERHVDYIAPVAGELVVALVDLRVGSPTERAAVTLELDAARPEVVVIPEGVGHGFFTPRSSALLYAVTRYWDEGDEFGLRWDDPALALPWPAATIDAVVSARDEAMPTLADVARLPAWSDRLDGVPG